MTIHHHEADSQSWLAANFMMMLLVLLTLSVIVIGGIFLARELDDDGDGGIDVDITDGNNGGSGGNTTPEGGQTGRWVAPDGTVYQLTTAA